MSRRRLTRLGAAAATLLIAATGIAAAQPGGAAPASGSAAAESPPESGKITDTALHYTLDLGSGWQPAPAPKPALAGFVRPDAHQTLALLRMRYPTRPAWRGKRHFFDNVEDGVKAGAPHYHRLRRRRFKLHGVPVLDLRYSEREHGGRSAVAMRFIFYRRYTLAAVLVTPWRARRARRQARRVVASFQPYLGTAAPRSR